MNPKPKKNVKDDLATRGAEGIRQQALAQGTLQSQKIGWGLWESKKLDETIMLHTAGILNQGVESWVEMGNNFQTDLLFFSVVWQMFI